MYGTIGLIRDRKDLLQQRHEQQEVRRRTLLQQQNNQPIVVAAAGVAVVQHNSNQDDDENAVEAARTRPTKAAMANEPKNGTPLAPNSLATMMIMTMFPPSAVSGCCTSVVDGQTTPPEPFVPFLNTAATTTTTSNNYSSRPAWYF
jgi:hypothetical protein